MEPSEGSLPVLEFHYLTYDSTSGRKATEARLRQLRAEALVIADEQQADSLARRDLDDLARACTQLLRNS